MRIQHNISAMNSYRQLGTNNTALGKNLEKLSSGYRINRAGDDAAGLAISEKMRSQIKGLETAQKNANDGISLVQTAEGALTEVHSMLNRMTELATQSANGTYDDAVDRENLQKEVTALLDEVNRISKATNFNNINLLDGNLGVGTTVTTAGTGSTWDPTANSNAGADAGTGVATEFKLDFTCIDKDSNFEAGATVEIGGVTFEFVKAATDVVTGNNKAVVLGADRDASITALATAMETNKGSVKDASGAVITDGTKAFTDHGDGTITVKSAKPTATATQTTAEAYEVADFGVKTSGIGLMLQIGDTADSFNKLAVSVGDMSAKALGISDIDISTQSGAADAIKKIKDAINTVSSTRGDLGAVQNRLEHTINNLGVTTENITAAESRIRDTDMASEMMAYTKNNILIQASQAMLAQANQVPQGVLQLLQ